MKLQADAVLSWSGRRLLVEWVLVEAWRLGAAAEAAGVGVCCGGKWVGWCREGDRRLRDRSSAPRRVANRTPADRVALIVLLRRLRMTAAEIAETLRMPLSTVSLILKRQGLGRLGRIGLEQPQRYERWRPGELVHVDVKKLGGIPGVGQRISGSRASQGKTRIDGLHRHRRPAVRPRRRRRLQPPRLCRGPRRRESDNSRRLPPPRDRLLRPLRDPRRAHAQRQRLRLPRRRPRPRLQSARRPPPANPPPPPTNQRQRRTPHLHPPIRPGIRTHPRLKPPTHRSTRRPAPALQPSTTTHSPQPPTTGQQNQPPRVLQLTVDVKGCEPDAGHPGARLRLADWARIPGWIERSGGYLNSGRLNRAARAPPVRRHSETLAHARVLGSEDVRRSGSAVPVSTGLKRGVGNVLGYSHACVG